MKTIKEFIEEGLKLGKVKIGFGLSKPDEEVLESLRKGKEFADIILVGPKEIESISDFEKVISDNPERKLPEILVNGEVDALIRGTIDDFKTSEAYAELIGKEKMQKMIILGLLEDVHGRQFFINTGHNTDGWTIEEKIRACEGIAKFLKEELEVEPKIAIMTGRRSETYERKKDSNDEIDKILNKTYEDAEEVVKKLTEKGINAKNYSIEIETALKEGCNIIVPPNGMVANQIFRTLVFLGGGKILTASAANLPHILEGGSRSEKDFLNHIKWVVAWANKKKQKQA